MTSEQVLAGLAPDWERQLRADIAGRTVVFVGYSARDLDFQPIWDDVLRDATQVYWFDWPDPAEQQRKTALLRNTAAAGKLHFLPAARPGAPPTNPSREFVIWCRHNGLATIDEDLLARLDHPRATTNYPDLIGPLPFACAAAQQVLGDIHGARRTYRHILTHGPHRRRAGAGLVSMTLNHGGRFVGTALSIWRLAPPIGRAGRFRVLARRKRATILANRGKHHAVLRITKHRATTDVGCGSFQGRKIRSVLGVEWWGWV